MNEPSLLTKIKDYFNGWFERKDEFMNEPTKTPLVDAAKKICGSFNRGTHEYVSVEFARQLEAELAEAKNNVHSLACQCEVLKEALKSTTDSLKTLGTFHRHSPTWQTCNIEGSIKQGEKAMLASQPKVEN